MIVEAVIQSGLIGLVAWLFLLGSIVHLAWKSHPSRQAPPDRFALSALTGTLTVLIIYGQFSLFFAQTPQMMFWGLLGILMAQSGELSIQQPESE
jgi:O-antigen ligase